MGFFNNFPYTNFHELNIDWILSKIADLKSDFISNQNKITAIEKENVEQNEKIDKVESSMPIEIRKIIADMVSSGEIDTVLESGITGFVNVLDFGAKGDGVTDDTKAFTDAIDHCITNNVGLYVPAVGVWNQEGGYILSKTVNITHPMVIICQPNSLLNWKNVGNVQTTISGTGELGGTLYETGYGFNFDYGTYGGHKGVYRFGILQGPKDYTMPGGTFPSGHAWTGVRIANGDLVNFKAEYISYWNVGMEFTTTVDGCYNADVYFHVMDDCATGLLFRPSAEYSFGVCDINFNTIGISKNSIVFQGPGETNFLRLHGNQVLTEYPGYCPLYYAGGNLTASEIVIENVHNRNSLETVKKTGDTSQWTGPIMGCAPGVSGWRSTNTNIKIGFWNGEMNSESGLMLNVDNNNTSGHIENTWLAYPPLWEYPLVEAGTAEDDYNGGIGGAVPANACIIKYTTNREVAALTPIECCFYSQTVTATSNITVTQTGGSPCVVKAVKGTGRAVNVTIYPLTDVGENWDFYFQCCVL